MNDISSVKQDALAVARELTARPEEKEKDDDRNMFLKLMITQLENQDPLNPAEGGEFLAQLAQFSTVEGIEKMNLQFESLASQLRSSQALQATALVGRQVNVPSEFGTLTGSGLRGTIELPESTTNLRADIFSPTGQIVHQLHLGSAAGGDVPFFWDGRDASGNALPPGEYRVRAFAAVEGELEQVGTRMAANVNSVTIEQDGSLLLNVAGAGPVKISDVNEIQ